VSHPTGQKLPNTQSTGQNPPQNRHVPSFANGKPGVTGPSAATTPKPQLLQQNAPRQVQQPRVPQQVQQLRVQQQAQQPRAQQQAQKPSQPPPNQKPACGKPGLPPCH